MKRLLFAISAVIFIFMVSPAAAANDTQGGEPTVSVKKDAEYWRKKSLEDFQRWRQSIPDYEKRLYERVKSLNHRTVRLLNVMIGGFILLLIAIPVLVYVIVSRVLPPAAGWTRPLPENGHGPESATSQSPERQTFPPVSDRKLRKILKQQKELRTSLKQVRSSLDELSVFLSETSDQTRKLSSFASVAEERLGSFEKEIEGIARPGDNA